MPDSGEIAHQSCRFHFDAENSTTKILVEFIPELCWHENGDLGLLTVRGRIIDTINDHLNTSDFFAIAPMDPNEH
jgi:hypothetical protein